ncbi:MAG: type II toxin-antitoxin system RelE/ParE family toxin [Chloroflexi bacterium]|nr:type II toxin-antitoxin system RelE/ParE family toxin [Chloroflexota bacterium]
MVWEVRFHTDFDPDFHDFTESVQDELLAKLLLLQTFGPTLGRSHVDTLQGSRYPNMKDLRFNADGGVWRVAFAFDPIRRCIVLAGANKSGMSQSLCYRRLIATADARYRNHLANTRQTGA